jgi:hypothetical protein
MPIINKISFAASRRPGFMESQQQPASMPIIPQQPPLKRDTVAFKAREASFLRALKRLCQEDLGNRDLMADLQGFAHDVDPKNPEVVAEFERIRNDKSLGEGLRHYVLVFLPKELGIGGNRIVHPRWGVDWSKDLSGSRP